MENLLSQMPDWAEVAPQVTMLAKNILAAILILIFGFWIARWLRKKIRGAHFGTEHVVDNTLRPIVASMVYYSFLAITLYAVLRQLQVEATGLLAVFGAAGLAIGLALKDTLGNIAAGFMLLILRPLNVGEFIDTPSASGTVMEVGLFSTTIKNAEGVYIFVPNGQIWANRIQNFGRHTERKLIINLGVAYETDLEAAKALLETTMSAQAFVKSEPEPPQVLITEFAEHAIRLSCRCWLPAENWLVNSSDMRLGH